jgi:hypothetical protein
MPHWNLFFVKHCGNLIDNKTLAKYRKFMKSTTVALFLSLGLTTVLTACGETPAGGEKGVPDNQSNPTKVAPDSQKEGGEGDEKGSKDKKYEKSKEGGEGDEKGEKDKKKS